MSSQQAKPNIRQRSTTSCTTCRSHQLECNGIRPSCDPCKSGNKTCVWPEYGSGPRRGAFTAAARPPFHGPDNASTQFSARQSRSSNDQVASGKQREGSGRLSKPAGGDGPQQTQQVQKRQQSQQIPKVPTQMRVISYQKLLEGDEETGAELLAACNNEGCFWLDLESEVEIPNSVEWLLRLSQTLHDVPQVEKWKYEEESPGGPNNIRYNYTTHPLLSPSEETDLHLSENWTFDLPSQTSPTTHTPDISAHSPNFNFPTPLQNPDNRKPFLSTLSHLHSLTQTLLTTLIPSFSKTLPTQTQSRVHLSRYPTTDTFSSSQSESLIQLRDNSKSIAMVFAPVPGTCVQDGVTGGVRRVVHEEGEMGCAFVGVGEGMGMGMGVVGEGKGGMKGGRRHVWDVGMGREGDWYEICFVMDVGGEGGEGRG